VSVSRVESRVDTIHDPEKGQYTRAQAIATGVIVGGVSIDEIVSEATTQAKGHDGSALTTFHRVWCGIHARDASGVDLFPPACFDPDDPANAPIVQTINTVNQRAGRVWITLPPLEQTKTPHGYQAIVQKDVDAQASDTGVNHDSTATVPGMQITVFNDGAEGGNRMVVQLANVQADSEYGVITVPDFGQGGGDTTTTTPVVPTTAALPAVTTRSQPSAPRTSTVSRTRRVTKKPPARREASRISRPATRVPMKNVSAVEPLHAQLPGAGQNIIERALRAPAQILRDAIHLLVTRPGDFALLFCLWSLLATPIYLFMRRRARAASLLTI